MKKLLSLIMLAGMFTFVACGPSAEDKAAQQKAEQDSIAAADSIMKAAEAQAMQAAQPDSMTAAPADTSMQAPK